MSTASGIVGLPASVKLEQIRVRMRDIRMVVIDKAPAGRCQEEPPFVAGDQFGIELHGPKLTPLDQRGQQPNPIIAAFYATLLNRSFFTPAPFRIAAGTISNISRAVIRSV